MSTTIKTIKDAAESDIELEVYICNGITIAIIAADGTMYKFKIDNNNIYCEVLDALIVAGKQLGYESNWM